MYSIDFITTPQCKGAFQYYYSTNSSFVKDTSSLDPVWHRSLSSGAPLFRKFGKLSSQKGLVVK